MIKYFFKKIFQIHSPSKEHHETDTECDLVEITHSEDTRRHFIREIYTLLYENKKYIRRI